MPLLKPQTSINKQLWLRLLLGICIIAGAIALFKLTPVGSLLQPETLRSLKVQLGIFAPLAYISLYVVATILGVPGGFLTLTGGALFGVAWGTLWTVIGATLGATGAFLVGRFIAGDWARRQFEKGDRLSKIKAGIEDDGFWFSLSIRLIPVFPFFAVNYLLSLTPLPLPTYVLTTAIGIIPGCFAYSWLGRGGVEAFTGGTPWQLIGALAVLAGLSLIPIVAKRVRIRN